MAVVTLLRTAIVIVSTILAAAVFSLTLLPRWRSNLWLQQRKFHLLLPCTTVPSSTTTPPATTPPNPMKDLPSMERGSVDIRPERLTPPANSSDIYYSLLTAPLYHNLRFSLQYLTWLQTVDPKHVSLNVELQLHDVLYM